LRVLQHARRIKDYRREKVMFITVNKFDDTLELYDETDFGTLNVKERDNIEKWVIEKPEVLGEDLKVRSNINLRKRFQK
jgi:murein L,D-transpeptidase YafK